MSLNKCSICSLLLAHCPHLDHPNERVGSSSCVLKIDISIMWRFVANMVAEHRCDESDGRICERTVDVRWPQVVEQVLGRTQTPSRDRTLQGTAEHILDVLVPDMVEHLVKLPNTVSQDRTVEQIVDTSDPQVVEKLVVISRVFSAGQRFAEQTGEIPDKSLAEKIVEGPVTQTQGKTQQVVNTHVQHIVNTVDAEVPFSQFIDMAAEIPSMAQRQISMVQTVQSSIENSTVAKL